MESRRRSWLVHFLFLGLTGAKRGAISIRERVDKRCRRVDTEVEASDFRVIVIVCCHLSARVKLFDGGKKRRNIRLYRHHQSIRAS